MCAQLASLPAAAPPVYLLDWRFPQLSPGQIVGTTAPDPEFKFIVPYAELAVPGQLAWDAGNAAGAGTEDRWIMHLGMLCRSFATTNFPIFQAHSASVNWQTNASVGFANPGYENPDIMRVQIWDIWFTTSAVFDDPFTDETGFLFIPYHGAAIQGDAWPSQGNPLGGFGITGRLAAPFVQGYRYQSYAAGTGAVLDTVDIPQAVVPVQFHWSHAQFVFVSSGPDREATLSLAVNGTSIFADKEFGTPELPFLSINDGLAYLYAPTMRVGDATGDDLRYAMRVRAGKFLLDGTEILF